MRTLSAREKKLVQVLVAVMVTVGAYFLVIEPLISLRSSSGSAASRKLADLDRVDKIYQEYSEARQEHDRIQAMLSKKDDNLTALVEQWAASAGITRNIDYTRRTQTNIQNKYIMITTDIKLNSVAIEPFLKFVHQVEISPMLLKISYLRVQQALKGRDTYDVNLKINNYTTP